MGCLCDGQAWRLGIGCNSNLKHVVNVDYLFRQLIIIINMCLVDNEYNYHCRDFNWFWRYLFHTEVIMVSSEVSGKYHSDGYGLGCVLYVY